MLWLSLHFHDVMRDIMKCGSALSAQYLIDVHGFFDQTWSNIYSLIKMFAFVIFLLFLFFFKFIRMKMYVHGMFAIRYALIQLGNPLNSKNGAQNMRHFVLMWILRLSKQIGHFHKSYKLAGLWNYSIQTFT